MAAKIQDADVKGSADVTSDARLINDNKIYVNSLSKRLDQAIVAGDLAGGGVGGVKNYLTKYLGNTGNGDFEANATTGWSLFNTTLTNKIPTGAINSGAASITTFATTATNKLAGAYSLNTASSAAWSAGQGFLSSAFTIDAEDQAKPIQISCSFSVQSGAANGNFSGTSSNTFAFYIYDVTNSAWIQPAGVYSIAQSSGAGFATGTFQTSSNGTQYRLAVICITATSGAISMNWDDFVFSPVVYSLGAAMYDPRDYVPTYAGLGTVTTTEMKHWRRGSNLKVQGKITLGTTTASIASFTLPDSLIPNVSSIRHVGYAVFSGTTAAPVKVALLASPSSNLITMGVINASLNSANGTGIGASGDILSIDLEVPIVGWSSNSVVSSDTDTRVVAASYQTSVGQSIPNNILTLVDFSGSKQFDTHNAYRAGAGYNSGTGGYTTTPGYVVQVPGVYEISAGVSFNSGVSWTAGNVFDLAATKNGSTMGYFNASRIQASTTSIQTRNGSYIVEAVAGDILNAAVQHTVGVGISLNTSAATNWINIKRLSGPSQIAASEAVFASARNSSGQSIANNSVVDWTGWTIDQNSHGALATTGVFTAPVSGQYEVFEQGGFNANGTGTRSFRLQKNGTTDVSYIEFQGSGSVTVCGVCVWQGRLNAGDTIKPQVFQNSGGALGIHVNDNYNKLIIKRIGN